MPEDEGILCRAALARAIRNLSIAQTAIEKAAAQCVELHESRASVRYSMNMSRQVRADARLMISAADRIISRAWSFPFMAATSRDTK